MPNRDEGIREKVTIDVANPEDARAIREVMKRGWLSTFVHESEKYHITPEDVEDRFKDFLSEENLKRFTAELADSNKLKFLVAKAKGEIVGVCGLIKSPGPHYNKPISFFVDEEYRGAGIALMHAVRKEFGESSEDIKTDVVAYNDKALRLYGILGFEQVGEQFEREWKTRRGTVKQPMVNIVRKAKVIRE